MNSRYIIICFLLSAFLILAFSVSARDLNYSNYHKTSPQKANHQIITDPEIDWPVWTGVQQTDRILTSFNCEGTFGLPFSTGDATVPEWTYRSFESPPGSGAEYLWAGAIWIGGIVNGDTLVSVGADGWNNIRTMYPTSSIDSYKIGSIRNFEYKSSYSLRAEISDTIPEIIQTARLSDPLNIDIDLRSHVWREAQYDQAVVYDMVITNIGDDLIEKGFVGLYMDADVCFDCSGTQGYADDLTGSLFDQKIAYIIDANGDFAATVPTPKAFAVKFLHTSFAPNTINYNWWISNGAPALDYGPRKKGTDDDPLRLFEGGVLGTPVSGEDKYYIMSHPEYDYDQARTKWIIDNDSTWIIYKDDGFRDFGRNLSMGFDTRFLISIGPFDLSPDSSVRIVFTTFTGEDIHTITNNTENLPDDPDTYLANLDFSDLITTAESAEQVMNDSLLDQLAPAIGLHLQARTNNSADLEWDPWVFDNVTGYEIIYSQLDHSLLPYPGVAAPWLTPGNLNLRENSQNTYKHTLVGLYPEQFYFAQIANKTTSGTGNPGPPLIFKTDPRASTPIVNQEFFFYQTGNDAIIEWVEPSGIDIDHYNIYRFDNEEQASLAYHAFYDQGRMSDSLTPKDNFIIDEITYYYYAMEVHGTIDSAQTSFTETNPTDEAVYIISAVSKRGFESHFSSNITTFLTPAKNKDFLLITNSRGGFSSFTEFSDIVSYYQNLLSGYDFDFYSVLDSTGGLCQPNVWPCIDWHDFMPYRYIIIDDKLHDAVWENNYESKETGFTKFLLSGGKLIYFGAFNGLREIYLDDSTGSYPVNNQYISRFFGIDTIHTVDLTQYAASSSAPFTDSIFGFIAADSALTTIPSVSFNTESEMFTSFLETFWPSNTAPVVAAFHPTYGTVTHTYSSLFPTTSLHHNKPVGIRTETEFGLTYLFGFHLWYMDSNDARRLIQWINGDIITDVEEPSGNDLPETFSLHQNFPNPFNPSTTINFELPKRTEIKLDIYNILGRKVKTLHSGTMPAGKHSLTWKGLNEAGKKVTSGVYFYRLHSDEITISRKMILLK